MLQDPGRGSLRPSPGVLLVDPTVVVVKMGVAVVVVVGVDQASDDLAVIRDHHLRSHFLKKMVDGDGSSQFLSTDYF